MYVQHPAPTAGGIFDRLDAEWTALCADRAVQTAVTDWLVTDQLADAVAAVTDAVTDGVTDAVTDSRARALGPVQLLAVLRTRDGHQSDALTDAVLRTVLRRAASRDRSATLAARIVVQAMIPAAVRMTRGQVRASGGRSFDDIGHMTVAALFEVARSGRIHTRPGRPAANLALDTLRHLCRELAADREERGEDLPAAEDLADSAPGPAERADAQAVRATAAAAGLQPAGSVSESHASRARLELLELVLDAMENGTLSPADGRAIAWHYSAAPVTDTTAAARAGTTAGAWQRRRSRAVARLTASLQLRHAA
ncbi:hypothetical protein OG949_40990 (plasmid) [Streptomyces scopuliridis]|uniref:hypothetical protein n=1 Tax=Streptomyces scopuliridis TaxID=452529 RepID=UPI002DD99D9B|nr:hypothetical protein [Streptomyces scopuliridis]WSB39120.1 hypothetical protein OG949_40990 [Streptomyces scopuliridis]